MPTCSLRQVARVCLGVPLCAQLFHAQDLLYVCLASHAPGRGSHLSTQKERSFRDAGCHVFIQPTFPEKLVSATPCAGTWDETENETHVLPSGADGLVGESGQETDDNSPGWGGLRGRDTWRAHEEELLMQPGESEATESFLEEVTTALAFKGYI